MGWFLICLDAANSAIDGYRDHGHGVSLPKQAYSSREFAPQERVKHLLFSISYPRYARWAGRSEGLRARILIRPLEFQRRGLAEPSLRNSLLRLRG